MLAGLKPPLTLRQAFCDSIGYPPPGEAPKEAAKFDQIGEDSIDTYYRAVIPVLPGVHAEGIYIVPKGIKEKAPLVIAMHGGGGSPEVALFHGGANYHDMVRGGVKRGYVVFAPQHLFSAEAEEQRRGKKRKRKRSPGRRPTRLKFEMAQTTEEVRPAGVPREQQRLVRERAVWRLRDGRAVLVGYRIFDAPGCEPPAIPGVTPRCEFGIEILVVLAFLVYLIGISLDKACVLLQFFCQLPIRKSQADALLRQLSWHWEGEFDTLCTLLTRAAVVYMDETGWKVGNEKCSLWAFLSDSARVFLFGCRKDAATLETILPPELFEGVGVSDNAAVYTNQFVAGQKCWAHLLRKAIRLSLLYPRSRKYKCFLDELLAIYRDGKRAAADGRLGEAGRKQRVAELEGRLCGLCNPHWREPAADCRPHERDFYNLVNELLTLVIAEELFTFVLRPEVDATNNLSERELRSPAQDRKAGRTNKTASGAHRRSVIVSVLQSLKVELPAFTLGSVVSEITGWIETGVSLFAERLQALPAPQPADTG